MQTNDNLRTLLKALPDLFFRIDANDIITEYQAGSGTELALCPKDVIGQSVREIGRASCRERG